MHPLVVVCVQGLGPQLVQVTISFGPVVAPVGGPPSRFFLPCDRVSVEETYILTYIFSMLNNDPSFDQSLLYSTPLSVLFSFLFLFLSTFALPLFKVLVSKWRRKKKKERRREGAWPPPLPKKVGNVKEFVSKVTVKCSNNVYYSIDRSFLFPIIINWNRSNFKKFD